MKISDIVLIDDDEDEYLLFSDAIKSIDKSIHIHHVSEPICESDVKHCALPNLVFLDINMPHRNGFEWLTWIKQQQYGIPVIMYSTSKSTDKIALSYQLGANLYLTKPLNFQELMRSLQSIISMDWSRPEEIRNLYYSGDRCKSFTLTD